MQDTLEVVAGQIIQRYKKGNDMLVSAAQLMLEAKRRIEKGEAGEDWTWLRWRAVHLLPHMSKNWINTQLKIAGSADPEAAAKAHRDAQAKSKRNSRNRKTDNDVVVDDPQLQEWVATFFDMPRELQDEGLRLIGAQRFSEAA